MGARGRKSKTEIEVSKRPVVEAVKRHGAPAELTGEQAVEWKIIVGRMSAEWFGEETHGLLVQYCCHRVAARHVAQLIVKHENPDDKETEIDLKVYDQLLKMQEREGRAMSSLATRMRLTQQTQYDKSRKREPNAPPPWEPEDK